MQQRKPIPPSAAVAGCARQRAAEGADRADMLLQEVQHRHANDLQLVAGLLALQGSRAASEETRAALREARDRVATLADARRRLLQTPRPSLAAALAAIAEALGCHAWPRGVTIEIDDQAADIELPPEQSGLLALAVNELATNAVKHAFPDGARGTVRIQLLRPAPGQLLVAVEDDGRPFSAVPDGSGIGLKLADRLSRAMGGALAQPAPGSKRFEIRLPA